jgi:imidazolonepropionase-like amidohydrolase
MIDRMNKKHYLTLLCVLALTLAVAIPTLVHPTSAFTFDGEAYAIRGGTIVTVTGATIPKGTVVIRNGLIEAVGAEIPIPGDARVIDASGMTVYPGLFDSYSSYGVKPAPTPASRGTDDDPVQALMARMAAPQSTVGLLPEVTVLDQFQITENTFDQQRAAGITTALTAPRIGVIQGQSALINLGTEAAEKLILKAPYSLNVGFTAVRGGYPGSLMGVFSFLRQSLLDAQHYREEWARYSKSPRGAQRPEVNKSLAALQPVINGELPVIFNASSVREIQRAIGLAEEFKLKYMIAGATQSYQIADYLKSKNATVLLSLSYPQRQQGLDDPERETLRALRERADAPKAAAALHKAGVRFAFNSGTLVRPQDYIINAARAVEAGLPKDEAVKAMTIYPAQIFGLSEQLGSIEKGKIANLVIATGDIFNRETRVRNVFVDGKLLEIKPPEPQRPAGTFAGGGRRGERAAATAPDAASNAAASNAASDGASGAAGGATGERSRDTSDAKRPEEATAPIQAQQPRQPAPDEILIRNATIMTASHGTIENGSILIRGGKIAAVGKDVKAPANAMVIDATGKYVTPGFVDSHSHTALDDVNEGSLSVTAMVRMRDVVNNTEINIYRQLAGGMTTIHQLHGSANSIGGQNSIIKLKWGRPVEEMWVSDAPRTIKFALGENPKRSNTNLPQGAPRRFPATRMGVEETIREAFIEGREYIKKWEGYEAAKARGENPLPPRRDLKLEAITDVLKGKIDIHAHCYRADEIVMLLRLSEEFGIKLRTLQHVLEGYKVAPEIARHGASASILPDWWAYKMEAYDAIPFNAAIMTRRGVVVSIHSDSNEHARRFYQEAAKMMKYGDLTEEEALRLVTLNPAIQIRMDHRIGSIDVGKDADLVIFNAHPFSIYSRPEMTMIEGEVFFDRNEDLKRRDLLVKEKRELIDRERRTPQQLQPTQAGASIPTLGPDEDDDPHKR